MRKWENLILLTDTWLTFFLPWDTHPLLHKSIVILKEKKKNHLKCTASCWVASVLLMKSNACKSMLSPLACSLLKITFGSGKSKIASADCKALRRKHYEEGLIASPLWWICPGLLRSHSLNISLLESSWLALEFWSLLFWNFLSAGGRTSVAERKCIRMKHVRWRKINLSAKIFECLFSRELWHLHWIPYGPSCILVVLNPSGMK